MVKWKSMIHTIICHSDSNLWVMQNIPDILLKGIIFIPTVFILNIQIQPEANISREIKFVVLCFQSNDSIYLWESSVTQYCNNKIHWFISTKLQRLELAEKTNTLEALRQLQWWNRRCSLNRHSWLQSATIHMQIVCRSQLESWFFIDILKCIVIQYTSDACSQTRDSWTINQNS